MYVPILKRYYKAYSKNYIFFLLTYHNINIKKNFKIGCSYNNNNNNNNNKIIIVLNS